MTRRAVLAVLVACAVGAFVLALRAKGLAMARDSVARERAALERTDADLRELAALRDEREVVAAQKRPTQDVIAQVNAVLRDAGLPTTRLKDLQPEADQPLSGRYRSQTIRLSLDHLSIEDVGALLAAWRAARTVWTPRAIELTHVAQADGMDGGFDARVVVAATYLSDAPAEAPR